MPLYSAFQFFVNGIVPVLILAALVVIIVQLRGLRREVGQRRAWSSQATPATVDN